MCYSINNDYLAHHGRLGQRWGKRNGPPYPLSTGAVNKAYKKKSLLTRHKEKKQRKELEKAAKTLEEALKKKVDHENNKERVLREGSAREVYEYRNELTNKELQDVVNRIKSRNELEKLSREECEKGWNSINRVMKKVGDVKDWTKTGTEMYNAINDVMKILNKNTAKNNSGGKK